MEIETIVTELGTEKRCVKCGEFWPAEPEFFQRNRDNPDGLDNYCKDCRQQARIKTQQTLNAQLPGASGSAQKNDSRQRLSGRERFKWNLVK